MLALWHGDAGIVGESQMGFKLSAQQLSSNYKS
jgi:hypothetical protein